MKKKKSSREVRLKSVSCVNLVLLVSCPFKRGSPNLAI